MRSQVLGQVLNLRRVLPAVIALTARWENIKDIGLHRNKNVVQAHPTCV